MDLEYRFCSTDDDNSRKFYQARVRYWLSEARRSVAFAYRDLILKDKPGYVEWMGNATWLLTQAAGWRELAKATPWRQPERKSDMVDSNTDTVECSSDRLSDSVLKQIKNTPMFYRRVPDIKLFKTLLDMRSIVWRRHYKNTMVLLCRRDLDLAEENRARRVQEYNDETHSNYNKLTRVKPPSSFSLLFNTELHLALCDGDEQKTFKADVDALTFYQELINKFRVRDIAYETRKNSTVKIRDWNYKERNSA